MDESDALKKTCPLFYVGVQMLIPLARPDELAAITIVKSSRCIGSDCMMWRVTGVREVYTGNDVMVSIPGGGGSIQKERRTIRQGECGFARAQTTEPV